MKQYDGEFLSMVADLAPDAPALSEREAQRLHSLALQRAGLAAGSKGLRAGTARRALLLAAIVGTAVVAAAAAYYSVSDAFRGVLNERGPAGEPVPISSLSPVVDKSGILVGKTASDNGVDVTVRGIVGDKEGFKIILDVVDTTGAALALTQPDGSLSRESIDFDTFKLRTEDTINEPGATGTLFRDDVYLSRGSGGVSSGWEWLDADPADNKTTIMFWTTTEEADLSGKTLYVMLENLKQYAVANGEGVGMEPNTLHDIVSRFDEPAESDFEISGGEAMQFYEKDENGVDVLVEERTAYDYSLSADSDKSVPLANGLPGYTVTNAAIRDGTLYLRGAAPAPAGGEKLFSGAKLYNPQMDKYLDYSTGGTDDDGETLKWDISFSGVNSLEELKGYVLMLNAGHGSHLLREGKWDFTIPLDYENTTKTVELDREFSVGGFAMTAKTLTFSPYTMRLKTAIGGEIYDRMMHAEEVALPNGRTTTEMLNAWDRVAESAVLTMKNGDTVSVLMGGGGGGVEDFIIDFALDAVIDPEQVASFSYGDLTVDI